MRIKVSRLVLVAATVVSLSGLVAAPANASTCQFQPAHKLVCDTIVEPALALVCNKTHICFE